MGSTRPPTTGGLIEVFADSPRRMSRYFLLNFSEIDDTRIGIRNKGNGINANNTDRIGDWYCVAVEVEE
jgi:hypothetical protein